MSKINSTKTAVSLTSALLLTMAPCPSRAVEARIHVPGTDSFNDVVYNGNAQSQQGVFSIKIIATCFGVHRKPVYNPISPVGTMDFSTNIAGVEYGVPFPVWVLKHLTGSNAVDDDIINLTAAGYIVTPTIQSAYAARNLVMIRAATEPVLTTIDAAGNYLGGDRVDQIAWLKFRYDQQRGPDCPAAGFCSDYTQNEIEQRSREFSPTKFKIGLQAVRMFSRPLSLFYGSLARAGLPLADSRWGTPDFEAPGWGNPRPEDPKWTAKDGPMGAQIKIRWAPDLKQLEVSAAFPSIAPGWCGHFYSPLMMFFDEARPRFSGMSSFKLNPYGVTNWVEAGAPGYFLAMDRNEDGTINDATELFGDQVTDKNGFEYLRPLDENRDGWVDSRDRQFKRLLLWQDRDGDGNSQPEELFSLAERGVKRISLGYRDDQVIALSNRAELRQSSQFEYVDGKGHLRRGDVVDVWLSSDR